MGVGVAVFVGVLGRSLAMDQLGFQAAAITAALGAAAGLLFYPLLGVLSDRFNRKAVLGLATTLGLGAGLPLMALSLLLFLKRFERPYNAEASERILIPAAR